MDREKLKQLLSNYLNELKQKLNELEKNHEEGNYFMCEILDEMISRIHEEISYIIRKLGE